MIKVKRLIILVVGMIMIVGEVNAENWGRFFDYAPGLAKIEIVNPENWKTEIGGKEVLPNFDENKSQVIFSIGVQKKIQNFFLIKGDLFYFPFFKLRGNNWDYETIFLSDSKKTERIRCYLNKISSSPLISIKGGIEILKMRFISTTTGVQCFYQKLSQKGETRDFFSEYELKEKEKEWKEISHSQNFSSVVRRSENKGIGFWLTMNIFLTEGAELKISIEDYKDFRLTFISTKINF